MTSDPSAQQKQSKERRVQRVVIILLVAPLFGFLLWLGLRTEALDDERLTCEARGVALQELTGTLRQAGPHFYVVAGNWRLIAGGCKGKYRLQCLRENPGVEALERHLGEPVQVTFCGQHALGYTVGGQKFWHGKLIRD